MRTKTSHATSLLAVNLMGVDDTEVLLNQLKFDTKGGRAVYVGHDSDRNTIGQNQITADLNASDAAPLVTDSSPYAGPVARGATTWPCGTRRWFPLKGSAASAGTRSTARKRATAKKQHRKRV